MHVNGEMMNVKKAVSRIKEPEWSIFDLEGYLRA
jgi:hypothetical protein